ncbi:hypothetical protein ACFLSJ_07990, partial [Verrucomicrobiota bacterium]
MPATNQRNQIIEAYVTTDTPLRAILSRLPEPRGPVAQALLYLLECIEGRRLAKEAVSVAQAAVANKDADPEIMVLMLSRWAELSCRVGRPSEADALMHRAKALMSPGTHPEVRAAMTLAESVIADTTGNKERCERLLRGALDFLPSFSPRRKTYLWELGLFLARQGRLVDCRDALRGLSLGPDDSSRVSRLLMVQFVDAVETGRPREASQLMS